jgi:hypothetical protein
MKLSNRRRSRTANTGGNNAEERQGRKQFNEENNQAMYESEAKQQRWDARSNCYGHGPGKKLHFASFLLYLGVKVFYCRPTTSFHMHA